MYISGDIVWTEPAKCHVFCAAFAHLLVRYPGDPQGQAWVGGARQYMAIKRVGGLDVAGFGKEEWQEMRFEWLDWLGTPIISGYISYIWLLKSDYIIVGYWVFLADFEWWHIWTHLRASASQWDGFPHVSSEARNAFRAMRWAPGISGTSWTCWMIPGVEILDLGDLGALAFLQCKANATICHHPQVRFIWDDGWWQPITPQLKKTWFLSSFSDTVILGCYVYIYMDARFVCTACLTSSDPPSHLESQLRRGMIHTKIRTEKPVWSCWVHSKWDLTRVKPPFLSKSIHHSMLVFLFTRKFAFLQQSTLHPSSWVNEKLRHRCSHWNHGECTRELSPILTQHFRWVKYDKFTRISYIYIVIFVWNIMG